MGASLRFLRGGRGRRRRQAHEQGLAACGVLGDGEAGKDEAGPPKGIPKGLVPWAGAGRARWSPAGRHGENAAAEEMGKGFALSGAPAKPPDGQIAWGEQLFPRYTHIRRAALQRLCPQGKQRRMRTLAAPLARPGKAASFSRPARMWRGINALWRGRNAPLPEASEATQIEASAPVRAVRKRGRSSLRRLLYRRTKLVDTFFSVSG